MGVDRKLVDQGLSDHGTPVKERTSPVSFLYTSTSFVLYKILKL